jgi:hypothetical protein
MLLLAQPAPNGAIVVVDEHVAHASVDGGRTYHAIDGIAASESFFGGAMSADGTFYGLHGDVIDVVRAGHVTTHAMPDARRVVVNGRTVAVLLDAAVAVSADGGATFVVRALPAPCTGCDTTLQGAVDFTVANGSPFVVETSINTCTSYDVLEYQRLVQIGAPTFQRSITVPRVDYAASWHFGAFGWMYGASYAKRLVAVSAAGSTPVVVLGAGLGEVTGSIDVAHNDRVTVANIGGALVELNGATARILDAHSKDGDSLAVDGDDRPLVSDGKELWRFSRVTGWSKLAMP